MSISNLPSVYLDDMKKILGSEYEAFLDSYSRPCRKALRINTLKLGVRDAAAFAEEFGRETGFHLTPVPWTQNGFYFEEEDQPSRHSFYSAGLYYLQEASAMAPAQILPVSPGETVLDLCAAPGGKATELGARLQGQGFLVANEISAPRARVLMKNLELFGIPNACVTNTEPARLLERCPAFFDRILVDAPCSGEGMFRKDTAVVQAWYPEKVLECARVQREIITCAADMLRPGGMMLYSTCTFAPQENELTILHLLKERPEMELMEIPYDAFRRYFSEGLSLEQLVRLGVLEAGTVGALDVDLTKTCRLWPHKIEGEGHFCALLRKRKPGENEEMQEQQPGEAVREAGRAHGAGRAEKRGGTYRVGRAGKTDRTYRTDRSGKAGRRGGSGNTSRAAGQEKLQPAETQMIQNFMAGYLEQPQPGRPSASETTRSLAGLLREGLQEGRLEVHDGQVYLMPAGVEWMPGIPTLRAGLYLGELKKNRFEPAQELAMVLPEVPFPDRELQTDAAQPLPVEENLREDVEDHYVCLDPADDRLERYLHGETIPVRQAGQNGWRLLCAGRYPIGWGKLVGGQLKNKFPAGWRIPG
ncbi:RsmB/NOP family class I SAM-dependent RNA methyltransferase [Porcincola intestinalis]|uniref:SAM-dependent methyltransferase n=1 Tax=Porcincola intestinalis TaxID=2606632 RepID=A0A6L5XA85_9FIRM|nr:RsmB/NOP family class I SAM-dependent RNA methyltransferase [Porcincola intestinalis]MSS15422.1 SAM-dependent methyltransferase [Porcincola intestinalis]